MMSTSSRPGRWAGVVEFTGLSSDDSIEFFLFQPPVRVHVLGGHLGTIRSLSWSPGGNFLAAACETVINKWDSTGDFIHSYEGHLHTVNTIAWSPCGRWIASGSTDTTLKTWHATYGDPDAAMSRDGVMTFDQHSGSVNAVAWSPNSRWLAGASTDTTCTVWRARTGECVHVLQGHSAPVDCLRWSPDASGLATGSSDCTVNVWRLCDGEKELEGRLSHAAAVTNVTWSSDSVGVASVSDCAVLLWSSKGGTVRLCELDTKAAALSWSTDGALHFLLVDGSVTAWDTSSGMWIKVCVSLVSLQKCVCCPNSPAGSLIEKTPSPRSEECSFRVASWTGDWQCAHVNINAGLHRFDDLDACLDTYATRRLGAPLRSLASPSTRYAEASVDEEVPAAPSLAQMLHIQVEMLGSAKVAKRECDRYIQFKDRAGPRNGRTPGPGLSSRNPTESEQLQNSARPRTRLVECACEPPSPPPSPPPPPSCPCYTHADRLIFQACEYLIDLRSSERFRKIRHRR